MTGAQWRASPQGPRSRAEKWVRSLRGGRAPRRGQIADRSTMRAPAPAKVRLKLPSHMLRTRPIETWVCCACETSREAPAEFKNRVMIWV